MSSVTPGLELGRLVAAELRTLGAKKVLVKAAEQGYITELACAMPTCFCPRGATGTVHDSSTAWQCPELATG